MSQIATETGIGRATLYKYFPDVEAILAAWHERQVARHLNQLAKVRDEGGSAGERLESVLTAYAMINHNRPHGTELAAAVHRGEHLANAQQQLLGFLQDLIASASSTGEVRDDVPAGELARLPASSRDRKRVARRPFTVLGRASVWLLALIAAGSCERASGSGGVKRPRSG